MMQRVTFSILILVCEMPARKRPASAVEKDRETTLKDCVSNSSKVGLAATLTTLHEAGLLSEDFNRSGTPLRKLAASAQRVHSKAVTPYGPIVQYMDLSCQRKWAFIHPLSLLYDLSTLCSMFAQSRIDCLHPNGAAHSNIVVSTRSALATPSAPRSLGLFKVSIGHSLGGPNGCSIALLRGRRSALFDRRAQPNFLGAWGR